MKKEIKPIKDFPGYFVSNYGEIYSTWTYGPGARSNGPMRRLQSKPSDTRWVVSLSKNNKRHTFKIHRLVLTTFVGPRPEKMEACHFPDRDTSNNRLDNLRWDTKKSNQADRVLHRTSNDGERNGSAKLKADQVLKILSKRALGVKYKDLAEEFHVSLSNIEMICQRKIWRSLIWL